MEIIATEGIQTQGQLAQALRKRGFKVTQATVSRDIKELGLVKVPAGPGMYRYEPPPTRDSMAAYGRLSRMFKEAVIKLDYSENLVLVKTLPGTAHAVASLIDQVTFDEVVGTVAGDDTILVIVRPKKAVKRVLGEFNALMS